MKRLVLALAALVTGAGVLSAQTVPVRLGGALSSFTRVPLDVPVEIDWSARADRLGSFTTVVRWDPAVLRLDGIAPGAFSAITVNADSSLQGVLRLAGANPNGAAGRVTVGVARFTPLQGTSTTIALDVRELAAAGPSFTNALADAAPQNGLYCPARGYWGDPDGDRSAGSRDALLALSAAVGLDVSAYPEIGLADVDANAAIEARDALIILSHAVGLDVRAFRIMRIAVGACGADAIVTYAVAPETATVTRNQSFTMQLRATSGGGSRTMPDVFWRSSDPAVVVVLQDGEAAAVGPGTATIIAKSGPRDSAVARLTVLARRPTHVVEATAVVNAIRLGNSEYPLASIEDASFVAQDGDTIALRAGRYLEQAVFLRNVVVRGGPGVRILGRGLSSTALSFYGAGTSEVTNVTIDSSESGIWAQQPLGSPPSTLRVVNVTTRDVRYPIATNNVVTTVQGADLARGINGIFAWRGGVDTVSGSTIADFDYAVDLEDNGAYIASNVIQRARTVGIGSYGNAGDSSTILANGVTCDTTFALGIDASDADHRIEGNTLTACNSGISVAASTVSATPRRLVLRGDTVAVPASANGAGISVSGAYREQIVGNVVTGGSSNAPGSIKVTSNLYSGRPPFVQLDSNRVQNAVVWAINVAEVDTLVARGNLIEDVAGASSCCFANYGGFTVGSVYGTLRLVGNTLRRIHTRMGIGINTVGPAVAVLDSNALSGADSAAIQIDAGALVLTGNNIQNNARYGLFIPFATGFLHQAHGNAFKGNALVAISTLADSVDAGSNWWGVDGQQPGVGGADAVSGRTGDLTPLASPPAVPALVPPIMLVSAPASAPERIAAAPGGTPLTLEQRRAAGRAGVERFAAARAERYRWYLEETQRRGRARP